VLSPREPSRLLVTIVMSQAYSWAVILTVITNNPSIPFQCGHGDPLAAMMKVWKEGKNRLLLEKGN